MADSVQPWYQQVPNIPNGYQATLANNDGGDVEGADGNSVSAKEQLAAALGITQPNLPAQTQTTGSNTGLGDAPLLPNVQGTQASEGTAARGGVPSYMADPGDRPITSLAQAFSIMIDVAAETMMQNGKLKNIFNADQINALKASAQDQIDQVQGERKSAANKLIGACVATIAVTGVALFGGAFTFGSPNKWSAGAGAALAGAGGAVTQLVNSATTYLDTCLPGGGQHQADEAKIRKAIEDIFVQQYKSQEDNFNNNYENSRKAVQNVLDMKRAIDDNTNQVALNILQNA